MSEARAHQGGWLNLAVDYGPLVIFFATYKWLDGPGPVAQLAAIVTATGIFMAATVVALLVSKFKLGHVSPMLLLSSVLIIGFGALTIWFHDPKFIQLKPTIIYTGLGALLLGGIAAGRPLLKYVLEAGFEGLSERGWVVLSRNWGLFFLAMAALNEAMVRNLSFDTWLSLKVWALIPLSVAFGIAHVPYMMKNGLGGEAPVPPAS